MKTDEALVAAGLSITLLGMIGPSGRRALLRGACEAAVFAMNTVGRSNMGNIEKEPASKHARDSTARSYLPPGERQAIHS